MANWQLLSFSTSIRRSNLLLARSLLAQGTQISHCGRNKTVKAVITGTSWSLVSHLTLIHPTTYWWRPGEALPSPTCEPLWAVALTSLLQGVWHRLSGSWKTWACTTRMSLCPDQSGSGEGHKEHLHHFHSDPFWALLESPEDSPTRTFLK